LAGLTDWTGFLLVQTFKRVPLEGEELEAYLAEQKAIKEAEAEAARLEQERKREESAARIHDYEGTPSDRLLDCRLSLGLMRDLGFAL